MWSNLDTLAQLEALAGKQWVDQASKSTASTSGWGHGSQSSATTTSQTERPRWPQAAIYGLQEGTCLVFRPRIRHHSTAGRDAPI